MIMTEKITLGMYHIVVPFLALHTPGARGRVGTEDEEGHG